LRTSAGGAQADTKVWTCPDVPGLTVRSEATLSGIAESTVTIEMVEFKTP
jgi:hypothetical protein